MRTGFSLVELSIVLVILGLLTGGILAGQSLIRAAELRSVSTEYGKYVTAVQSFRDKYFALPGDMKNATSFWGAAHATPATCVTTPSTTIVTCNGDGDARVEMPTDSPGSNELYRFWQQLANAGLIEGTYDGVTHGASEYSSTAANSPRSKSGGSNYWFTYPWGVLTGQATFYDLNYGQALVLGSLAADTWPSTPAFTPEEAWNIDTKLDDGKPARGKLVAQYWNNLCAAADDGTHASSDLAASYRLSDSTPRCVLIFREAF